MTSVERLERMRLAVERVEELEASVAAALAEGAVIAGQIPDATARALREAADDVLRHALPWDVLLEAARTLAVSEPFGGRDGYSAYLGSLHLYSSPTAELVQ